MPSPRGGVNPGDGGIGSMMEGSDSKPLEETIFDDGARAIWRVEAAPVGALATFELELDEITGSWQIRPTSRPR
jgi:hypothetical protein